MAIRTSQSDVQMPTAEAIAALRKRRAASLKPSVIASAKPVDVCAKARELTMKAKAAANLNKAAPQPRTKVAEVNTLSSFLRNSTKNKAVVDEATSTRIAEAEQLRQMRARAAKADRNSGVTVNVPSALALHQLKQRRDKAASTKNENVGSEDAARRLLAGTLVGRSKIQVFVPVFHPPNALSFSVLWTKRPLGPTCSRCTCVHVGSFPIILFNVVDQKDECG